MFYLMAFAAGMIIGCLLAGGICRYCKEKEAISRPFAALANGVAYLWITAEKGLGRESFLLCLCASVLFAVAVIDEKTFEIPLVCNLLLGAFGGFHLLFHFSGWQNYAAGMGMVSGVFLLIYFLTGKKGIGGGDIKLMAAAGLLLGWQKILLALWLGAVSGAVLHLIRMKWEGKPRILALGPYLSGGIFVAMLYGDEMLRWYFSF